MYTDYKALEDGLRSIRYSVTSEFCSYNGKTVAIPYGIGCGLAGGDWDKVYKIIDEVFHDYEVTLYKLK